MSPAPVTILDGPFMGFKGTVLREKGDQLVVRVNVFGRDTEVTLDRRVLGLPGATLDTLEAEVVEAVSRRGFRQRLFGFWQEEVRRAPQRPDAEILRAFEAFSAELLKEEEAAHVFALRAFRAEYAHLDPAARDAKWAQERERWTAWRDEARAVSAGIEGPLLGQGGDLEGLNDAAVEMRRRVEASRRKVAFTAEPVAALRNPDLEAQIARDPEADAPYLVYGDWLSGQGDPRGELIALQAAGPDRRHAEAALRRKLSPRLLGPLAGFEEQLKPEWRLGFLTALTVETTRDDEGEGFRVSQLLEAALRLPSAQFIRALAIGCPSVHEDGEAEAMHRVLAAAPRPLLRKLAFFTNDAEEMLSWTSAGRLVGSPTLEELSVHAGGFSLVDPVFPRLRALSLRTCHLAEAELVALAAADWPALEALELWVGSESYGVRASLAHFAPLLASPRLPRLKRLALGNNEFTDGLCAAVLDAPLLPRLQSLALTMGTMTEAGAQTLIAGADRLRHLASIDVDDNYLPDDALAELQRVLPQVVSASQRTPEEYEGKPHRYASVGE